MDVIQDGMSPRDWFAIQRVTATVVNPPLNVSTLVAKENPDRVLLMILSCASGNFAVAPFASTTTNNMYVTGQNGQFVLNYDQHGKACQIEWYVLPTGMVATVIVIEGVLDRTPAEYQASNRSGRNAPVSSRGSPARRSYGLPIAGAKSISGWLDNLGAIDQSLHHLIRRRDGGP